MRYSRVTRSSNIGNIKPVTNSIKGTSTSAVLSKKERYPPLTQKSKEDDYISSLQKQVYYLELEMKAMKDRELDTKNKIGGYEVLFRDGVPLNENFLALKTKYKKYRILAENSNPAGRRRGKADGGKINKCDKTKRKSHFCVNICVFLVINYYLCSRSIKTRT